MSYSIELERAFLAKEYSRETPSKLRILGTLLDSAFEQAPSPADEEAAAPLRVVGVDY